MSGIISPSTLSQHLKKEKDMEMEIWIETYQFKHSASEHKHCRSSPTDTINTVLQHCTCTVLILLQSIYSQPESRQICTAPKLRLAPSVLQKQFAAQTCLWRSVLERDGGKQRPAKATK